MNGEKASSPTRLTGKHYTLIFACIPTASFIMHALNVEEEEEEVGGRGMKLKTEK